MNGNKGTNRHILRIGLPVFVVLAALLLMTACGTSGAATGEEETAQGEQAAEEEQAPQEEQAPEQEQASEAEAPAEPIKIGVTTPITGQFAAAGNAVYPGIQIAAEDYNATADVPVELVFEDCGSDTTSARNAALRLMESDPAAVLNFCLSAQLGSNLPIMEEEHVATMVLGQIPSIYDNGWDWIFGGLPIMTVEGTAGLQYLAGSLEKERIAVFLQNDDVGKSIEETMQPTAESLGIDLEVTFYQSQDTDFSGNIAAARRNNPDAYLVIGNPADSAVLVRQLKQAGVEETMMTNVASVGSFQSLLEPQELVGLYGFASALPELSTDPEVVAFGEKYQELAGRPMDWMGTTAYDAATIMFKAAADAQGDRETVIENLHATQGYQGLSGEFGFDDQGRGRFSTIVIRLDEGGQIEVLETVKVSLS